MLNTKIVAIGCAVLSCGALLLRSQRGAGAKCQPGQIRIYGP